MVNSQHNKTGHPYPGWGFDCSENINILESEPIRESCGQIREKTNFVPPFVGFRQKRLIVIIIFLREFSRKMGDL